MLCDISNELDSFRLSLKRGRSKLHSDESQVACSKTKNINYQSLKFIENYSINEEKRYGYRLLFDKMRRQNDTNTIEFMMLANRVNKAIKRYPKDRDLRYIRSFMPNHIVNFPWDNYVRIKNIKYREYLSSTSDAFIRVGKNRDVISLPDGDCFTDNDNDDPCMWKISPKPYETFGIRLLNSARGEILYASAGRKRFDGSKRNVYLDREDNFNEDNRGGDLWMFEPIHGLNFFRIFNLDYCEYLYSGGDYLKFDVDQRRLYTWRQEDCDGRSCQFLIETAL